MCILTTDSFTTIDEQAKADKERYNNQMKNYEAPAGTATKGAKGKATKKAKKDPNAPKRGQTSFMFFSNEVRAKVKQENPDLTFGELGKKIGEMFKALTPQEKEKYEKLASKDKQRYQDAMKVYNQKQKVKADAEDESDGVDEDQGDDDDDDDDSE